MIIKFRWIFMFNDFIVYLMLFDVCFLELDVDWGDVYVLWEF